MSDHVDTSILVTGTAAASDFGQGDGARSRAVPQAAGRAAPAAQSDSSPITTAAPSAQEVQAALERINEHLAAVNRVIQLQVDTQTGLTIATVRNSDNGEVLQQYPAEDSLHLAQMLAAWSHGGNVLLDLIA